MNLSIYPSIHPSSIHPSIHPSILPPNGNPASLWEDDILLNFFYRMIRHVIIKQHCWKRWLVQKSKQNDYRRITMNKYLCFFMLSWHCQCFPNTRKCFPKNYSLPHIQAPQETLLRFKLNKFMRGRLNTNISNVAVWMWISSTLPSNLHFSVFSFFNQNKLPRETLFPPLRCDI